MVTANEIKGVIHNEGKGRNGKKGKTYLGKRRKKFSDHSSFSFFLHTRERKHEIFIGQDTFSYLRLTKLRVSKRSRGIPILLLAVACNLWFQFMSKIFTSVVNKWEMKGKCLIGREIYRRKAIDAYFQESLGMGGLQLVVVIYTLVKSAMS